MRYFAYFFLILICLYSCISVEDSLAANTDESESQEKIASYELKQVTDNTKGLIIETDPLYANIYINNKLYDTSPCNFPDLDYGVYYLTIQKEGYYPYSAWITYSEKERYYIFFLKPILGTLSLQIKPEQAIIELGDKPISSGTTKIPAGSYKLRARAFGYSEYLSDITITEEKTTSLIIELKKAPLEISYVTATRAVFNPANSGTLGTTTISFKVSTFCKGEAVIYNSQAQQISSYQLPSITDWIQTFVWNGRDKTGTILADGTYTVQIKVYAENGQQALSERTSVVIDSAYNLTYRNLWSGASGLLYAPTIDVLPWGGIQLQTLLATHFNATADEPLLTAPSVISARIGLPLNSELNSSLKFIVTNIELEPAFGASFAYKMRLLHTTSDPVLSSGFIIKFSYQHDYTFDTYADFSGGSLGIPVQLKLGAFCLVFTPEIIFSWQDAAYSSSGSGDYDFYTWLYGRLGIFYDTGFLTCGLSLSMRTSPLNQGFAFDLPLHAGFEFNALLPHTPLYVSGLIAMEYLNEESIYLLCGLGLGMVW